MSSVTKVQAEKIRAWVEKTFEYATGEGKYVPTLFQYETGVWSIVWEEGPYEWAINIGSQGIDEELYYLARDAGASPEKATEIATVKADAMPYGDTLFLEPHNGYSAGIYPL